MIFTVKSPQVVKVILTIIIVFAQLFTVFSQSKTTEVIFEKGEFWWGGVVGLGAKMPFIEPVRTFDLARENLNNQVVPFFISNKGRYVWSDKPFKFSIETDKLIIQSNDGQIRITKSGNTLRSAFLAASQKHFPPAGKYPNEEFFTKPQYNTWIELMYNQNEKDILNYAQHIIDHKFPTGILMIDDNWQRYYGNFDFKSEKFPQPKEMISKLHQQGFKVMVWVSPFVSSDSPEYRELQSKGFLLKRKGSDEPAMITWWNGKSACYDLTNPKAYEYFVHQLKTAQQKYGIDGFKFDAGDNGFYDENEISAFKKDAISVDHTAAWQQLSEQFPFHEFRAGWKGGGQPIIERLGDKNYSWRAVRSLIPEMLTAGLLGYPYTCPDMIGGGQFSSFLNIKEKEFNQHLIVRSAQVHALMPMMQFSVAPWRILNSENLEIVRQAALLHEKMAPYILKNVISASKSGEPIVRWMEYSFPNQGYESCADQFMLGDTYLVAPILDEGNQRSVKLPAGNRWKDDEGKIYKGGQTVKLQVPLSRLVYFEKL